MAKAKITDQSLIHFELEKLEAKVNQFQTYLEMNPITAVVTQGNEVILTEENQDKLHKEILIQIKIQDVLFNWLPALEKLKEKKVDKISTRGDIEVSGLFKRNTE